MLHFLKYIHDHIYLRLENFQVTDNLLFNNENNLSKKFLKKIFADLLRYYD